MTRMSVQGSLFGFKLSQVETCASKFYCTTPPKSCFKLKSHYLFVSLFFVSQILFLWGPQLYPSIMSLFSNKKESNRENLKLGEWLMTERWIKRQMVGGLFNMKEREVSRLVRYEWISDRYGGLQYVNKLFDTCLVSNGSLFLILCALYLVNHFWKIE